MCYDASEYIDLYIFTASELVFQRNNNIILYIFDYLQTKSNRYFFV